MQSFLPIAVISAIFLLSLAGAVVLFKYLKSYAKIKKTQYQAGGALAGFLLIYGSLYASYANIQKSTLSTEPVIWTVAGDIMRSDTTIHNGIIVRLVPPVPTTSTDESGQFRLENIRLKKGAELPEIYIESGGYYPLSLQINEENATIDESAMVLKLKENIKLEKIKE